MLKTDFLELYKVKESLAKHLEFEEKNGALKIVYPEYDGDIDLIYTFNKPAEAANISDLDKLTNVTVHKSILDFYSICDGAAITGTDVKPTSKLKLAIKDPMSTAGFDRKPTNHEVVFADSDIGQSFLLDLSTGKIVNYDTEFPDDYTELDSINAFIQDQLDNSFYLE
jgi:hypothetical protein